MDYDRTSDALYHGGFGDVWKGEYGGQDVAVKVIRIYSQSELQRVINVGLRPCPITAHSVLIASYVEILQGSRDVEIPQTSEHPATNRSDNVEGLVCGSVGMDGKWKHQRIRQGTSGRRPAWACKFISADPFRRCVENLKSSSLQVSLRG